MKILSINAGSSSLKFTMFEMPEEKVLVNGLFEKIGIEGSKYTIKLNGEKISKEEPLENHTKAVKILLDELINLKVISSYEEIEGVGHRLVHGGSKFADSVLITDDVLKTVEELIPLAPLHNPANLTGVKAFRDVIPNLKDVAVFDTAFHQTMKKEAFLYPVPYEWYTEYGVRKYGFHGASHKYLANRLEEITNKKGKFIICHLGNGGSISAVKDGICINTTMGFTPNAGIMMGTRCGDVDSTIIPYIMEQTGKSLDEVMDDLNKKSGYLGISGVSSDSRDVEQGIKDGNERCILAQNMFVNKVAGYIARYFVCLEGCDAICFSAGIGENSIDTRKNIVDKLKFMGIKVDEERNGVRGVERLITADDSTVPVYVIPTDEEVMIARDTYNLIK